MVITPETVIRETVERYPRTIDVYKAHNLRCYTCKGNASDTVGDAASNHVVKLETLLRDLNAVIEQA